MYSIVRFCFFASFIICFFGKNRYTFSVFNLLVYLMGNVLNNWVSSEVLAEKRVGRTSVIFTKKALMHVLEQHSEEKATETARLLNKICFLWTDEVDKMGREIIEKLPDELERYRRNGVRLTEDPRQNLISHLYLPWCKDWIVQLKFLKPDTFEIVSFYKKRQ